MQTGPSTTPPPGFARFCLRWATQCAVTKSPATIALQASVWATLNQINDRINATIAPESDAAHYGLVEYWTIPTDGYGDCEDYALAKRRALIAYGLPANALRIATAILPDGGAHTTLIVSTDRGAYVLDNLRRNILPWTDTGYVWIKRQAANDPNHWTMIGDGTKAMRLTSILWP